MKLNRIISALFALCLYWQGAMAAVEIERMDPPFWYTGMKNHEVQVMFYGKNIANSEFKLKDYPGVSVKEVAKVKNPNYLIVYLDVTDSAKPGTLTFDFKEDARRPSRSLSCVSATARPARRDSRPKMSCI